jgi:histone H3/H4
MQITVDVSEERILALVRQRIAELFSDDARFRETNVRQLLRGIVDDGAVAAVSAARNMLAGKLADMARDAVELAVKDEIATAAKRGITALRKLYAGFDPAKLTADQRAWLEKQIAGAADDRGKQQTGGQQ